MVGLLDEDKEIEFVKKYIKEKVKKLVKNIIMVFFNNVEVLGNFVGYKLEVKYDKKKVVLFCC